MSWRRAVWGIVSMASALVLSADAAYAVPKDIRSPQSRKVSHAERQAAAARAEAIGLALPEVGMAAMAPGAVPRYFSHPNYANSPQPTAPVVSVGNPLVARTYATDFATPPGTLAPVLVVLGTPLPVGVVQAFQTFNQATAGGSPTPSAGSLFHAYVLRPMGANQYLVVFDSGELTVPPATDPVGQVETFPVGDVAVQAGDVLAFYGQGVPVDITAGTDVVSVPAPAAPVVNGTITLGDPATFPVYPQARTYSFGARMADRSVGALVGGIRKFVDGLPRLTEAGQNNLGQYIPLAVADTTTYPGSDYYEIGLVQYREQMHTDLPATLLRGYVQLETGDNALASKHVALTNATLDPLLAVSISRGGQPVYGFERPHYLGPAIVATKGKPVRILFRNLLPAGEGGNLFLPVDTTVMGSGMGPAMGGMGEPDPQRPMCGMTPKPRGCFPENRATLHLHGGVSPWISDGTPHQWTTPADEWIKPFGEDPLLHPTEGVSVSNVPDMWFDAAGNTVASCAGSTTCAVDGATNHPGAGGITFFYTNQQSARLMFYHDHAWGITRLNVYAGEAAPYVIRDDMEQQLLSQGLIPADEIPLVIQDKTFVPSEGALATQDETWDPARWGGLGNLWLPHVYVPAQNPGDSSGVNQFGRWAYGPWFWPPTGSILYPPIPNEPYYDPACDPDLGWCEPEVMPGTPFVSMGMESFHDTPVVNGTAYPTLTVEPKAYRFRILNAANDRFWNLQLYKADASGKEVALNPSEVLAAKADPAAVFPTPAAAPGPEWIQIGTEGGFLPAPVKVPHQPITWVSDPTVFNAGNVDQHALLLGPAERADVIVDFTEFAGTTLILYNDAPAAFPARDPRYDYYTDNVDLRSTGGADMTLPGFGPNTRTVMQIVVAPAVTNPPAVPFSYSALETAFRATSLGGLGVFAESQHPIIVGQGAYNTAYGTAFKSNGPRAGLVQIFDASLTFDTMWATTLTLPLERKAIQDEMGEAFEKEYGRMSGNLGLEVPNTQAGQQQNLILYPYMNPPSELIDGTSLPRADSNVMPISTASDGTQIWKITHNGVDTHPIHFHLFDVQLLNRVGWDGIIRRPDATELGWKDTLRISPLEDTIVALRPILPQVPFPLPNSVRPLNPMMPLGSTLGFNSTDADGNPTDPIVNRMVNFGWEYVWHCHILSHEEMDMMRPVSVAMPPAAPTNLGVTLNAVKKSVSLTLSWSDSSNNETAFLVQRRNGTGNWVTLATLPAGTTTYTDATFVVNVPTSYQVVARNTIGYGGAYMEVSADSPPNAITPPTGTVTLAAIAPQAASNAPVVLGWTYAPAGDQTGFRIQRATNASFTSGLTTFNAGDVTTFSDRGARRRTTYYYRVAPTNLLGPGAWSATQSITTL